MTSFDPVLREQQKQRADALREEAGYHAQQARTLVAQASLIERTWEIPPPCTFCGSRSCSH